MTRKRLHRKKPAHGKLIAPSEPKGLAPDKTHVVLAFRHWNRDRWCISECEKAETKAFAKRLQMMTAVNWEQLKKTPRDRGGWEKIENSKQSLPRTVPGSPVVRAIRIKGKVRLIGYESDDPMEGHCFQVVAVDRNGDWYDH